MNKNHEHSLSVRLNKESNKVEIYCQDHECCFNEKYDEKSVTHKEAFGQSVNDLKKN